MAGGILALDLATRVGWCAGIPGGRPAYGVVMLSAPSAAGRYAALLDWLDDAAKIHKPARIVFEAPLARGQHSGVNAGRLLLGLAAMVELWGHDNSVLVAEEHSQTTRKAVIGRGTFAKGTAKSAVLEWCQSKGFEPPDDNAADAIVLWTRACAVISGKAAA